MTDTQQLEAKPDQVSGVRPQQDSTGSDKAVAAVSHVMLSIWALIVIAPLLWTIITSFKSSREVLQSPFALPKHWLVSNYVSAWNEANIGKYFFNTIIVVGSALVVVMALGAMCAYVLARFKFFGSGVIYYAMLAGLTFPPFLAIVPLFNILKNMNLLNTLPGLSLVYVAFALPFTVFFLYSFFKTLPYEISEAAAIDGAGEWRTFFQIMLPMAKPGIASVAIFNFLGLWNQFLLPLALNTDEDTKVLSQGMRAFQSAAGYDVNYGAMFAAAVITIVPVLIIYVIFQKQLQGGVSQGTMK